MSEGQVVIAIDAMGGENSPYKVLKGVEIFLQKEKNTKIILFGDDLLINQNIKKHNLNIFNFEIINTKDILISTSFIKISFVLLKKFQSRFIFYLFI